jgi:sporulation protein YlmC with PRC-barrel domain
VLTDTGVRVGTITDVVVDTGSGDVVGYEVRPADEPDTRKGRRSYLPLPETGAVSGEALIVPAGAVEYISNDLAGFGEAIDRYRDQLRGPA